MLNSSKSSISVSIGPALALGRQVPQVRPHPRRRRAIPRRGRKTASAWPMSCRALAGSSGGPAALDLVAEDRDHAAEGVADPPHLLLGLGDSMNSRSAPASW